MCNETLMTHVGIQETLLNNELIRLLNARHPRTPPVTVCEGHVDIDPPKDQFNETQRLLFRVTARQAGD